MANTRRKWTSGKIIENKKSVDVMILSGYKLEEIGIKIEVTKEYIRQYIRDNGFYDSWKKAKSERRQIPQRLVDIILNYTLNKAKEECVEDAVLYYLGKGYSTRKSNYDLTKLVSLVAYYKTMEAGGYRQLAELSGIGEGASGASKVQKVLRRMGKKSLNWNWGTH